MLSEFQQYYTIPGMKVYFSKNDDWSQLNVIFLQTGLKRMLKGEDYHALDFFFPSAFAYVSTWARLSQDVFLTNIHVQNTIIINLLMWDNYKNGWAVKDVENMRETVCNF